MLIRNILCIWAILALFQPAGRGQSLPLRLIPDALDMDWAHIETEHFTIHYGDKDILTAEMAAKFAEQAVYDMGLTLEIKPGKHADIYLFRSQYDLARTPLYREPHVKEGGIIPFESQKTNVVVPASNAELAQEMRKAVLRLAISNAFFGGTIQYTLQNNALLHVPEWYYYGIQEYFAEGWTSDDEISMAAYLQADMLEAALEGNTQLHRTAQKSVWYFIENQYGRNKIPEILFLSRIARSVESGIITVLGVSLNTFTDRWREFILNRLNNNQQFLSQQLPTGIRLPENDKIVLSRSLHPSGKKEVVLTLHQGWQEIWYHDLLSDGWQISEVKGGFLTDQITPANEHRLISWSPDGNWIAATLYIEGKEQLILLDTLDMPSIRSLDGVCDVVHSLAWNRENGELILSGYYAGQNDLFSINPMGNGGTHLTEDAYDDLYPVIPMDGQSVIFSSTRTHDTLPSLPGRFFDTFNTLDLYQLSLPTDPDSLNRLTSTPMINEKAIWMLNSYEIMYLTDAGGGWQLAKRNLFFQDSTFLTNIFPGTDICVATDSAVMYRRAEQGQNVWEVVPLWNGLGDVKTPTTLFFRLEQVVRLTAWEKTISRLKHPYSIPETLQVIPDQPTPDQDSTGKKKNKVRYYIFDDDTGDTGNTEQPKDKEKKKNKWKGKKPLQDGLYPDFDTITIRQGKQGPLEWESGYATNIIGYAPFYGVLTYDIGYSWNDRLENHRFIVGARPYIDFKSASVYGSYQRLAGHWLFSADASHNTRYEERNEYTVRYNWQQGFVSGSYILGRFATTGLGIGFDHIRRYDLSPFSDGVLDGNAIVASGSFFYHIDRTVRAENYRLSGWRADFSLNGTYHVNASALAFVTPRIEMAGYIPVSRKIVLAIRAKGAASLGNDPQLFMLGSTDNCLLGRFFNHSEYPLNQGILNARYTEFITPVRGFLYNERNGRYVALVNMEIRIPLRRLTARSLNADPLYQLQLVPFLDVGTVWSAGNPLSQRNPINTATVADYPVTITVQTLRSPFLVGFGSGLRTMMLGYDMRLDLGWGLDDGALQKPRLQLTLGKDF